jgi:undecaprenyl diphosphate synthase
MNKELLLDKNKLPQHIAFIVDGNRRWAKENKLPSLEGHRRGANVVLRIIDDCLELGIPVLTFYLFSTENWKRTKNEVSFLMNLGLTFLKMKIKGLHSKGIRIKGVGRIDGLEKSFRDAIYNAEELTKNNKKMTLNLAVNYGGRTEIIDAVNKILENESIKKVDEQTISENLYTAGLPDPDLLIRTSGESRISNFLLWQIAYAEIVIIPEFWPDLSKEKLYEAIAEYQRRQRRWGK